MKDLPIMGTIENKLNLYNKLDRIDRDYSNLKYN